MKQVSYVLLALPLLLLTSCGASAPPPVMALSCTTRNLPAGLVEARVTLHNTSNIPRPAVVYGPALRAARYIHPVLRVEEVVVRVGKSEQTFPGWIVPHVTTGTPTHITFHLAHPAIPAPILTHDLNALPGSSQGGLRTDIIHAANWDVLKNGDCTVK